jgi:hypothetical protein
MATSSSCGACRWIRPSLELLEDRTLPASGIGVFLPTTDTFLVKHVASAGAANANFRMPAPGAMPVVGDWNGDGKDDFGVFDTVTATWSLRYGAENGPINGGVFQYGQPGNLPVVGDWNGDGRDDIGVFNPLTARWSLRYGASPGLPNAGEFVFGRTRSMPVVGDWNGDGKDGIGTYSSGNWMLRQSASPGTADAGSFRFGAAGRLPVVGDWNGDRRDGIGTFTPASFSWSLRQTANAGSANAGSFRFGQAGSLPLTGDFRGPAAPANAIATVQLKPLNLDLLGLEVHTSPITVYVSATTGNGKLLGNLLNTVNSAVDLDEASRALNTVLGSAVDLLNSVDLSVLGIGDGLFDTATVTQTQVLELFVAPVHLDLLGARIDTSPVRVTITAKSGPGQILGNVVTELVNLFNPPLPNQLDINFLNSRLDQLLAALNEQIPGIPSAPVPPVTISEGQVLNITVPPLDLDLLGLELNTSPITVNATANTGDGLLLGNVVTVALRTLDATPQNLAELSQNINELLAKVVGVLNAADLTVPASVLDALPPALRTLLNGGLIAPAAGSTAPILDLVIASTDGTSPPIDVDLLGLNITTSDIDAHLTAVTGEGQVLGNLLYNVANLANPNGPASLLAFLNQIGAGNLTGTTPSVTLTSSAPPTPEELLTVTLNPLDIDLLGLEIQSEPITVTIATQGGDGKLLGNLLTGLSTLINFDGVGNALNTVLATTVNLVNSVDLLIPNIGSGPLTSAPTATIPVLDAFIAPVRLDLLGAVITTSPIRLRITAHSGEGLILGNVVSALANLFNPPLPDQLDIDFINSRLALLLQQLNQHLPGITPAPVPPVQLGPGQFLSLTVPPIDVNLLGLVLKTSPITVNATAQTGNGLLLGNVLNVALNTLDATPGNLTALSNNLNALLAKIVGVLNASSLVLPANTLDLLPSILRTLASPFLVATTSGATTEILHLTIQSGTPSGTPVDINLLGLQITTSNIDASLQARTGQGQILGNLLYNVANLLNPRGSSTLLWILAQLGQLRL